MWDPDDLLIPRELTTIFTQSQSIQVSVLRCIYPHIYLREMYEPMYVLQHPSSIGLTHSLWEMEMEMGFRNQSIGFHEWIHSFSQISLRHQVTV